MITEIKEVQHQALRFRQTIQRSPQQLQAPSAVEIGFELWHVRDEPLIDGIDIFQRPPAAPVVANSVANDLHQQSARMCYVLEPLKGFQRMKGDILFKIFIVKGGAGAFGREVNKGADFHRIQIHVTVLLDVRLYLT